MTENHESLTTKKKKGAETMKTKHSGKTFYRADLEIVGRDVFDRDLIALTVQGKLIHKKRKTKTYRFSIPKHIMNIDQQKEQSP